MARLDLRLDTEKGGTLISFQGLYLDYLDENGLIDPKDVKPSKPFRTADANLAVTGSYGGDG